MLRSMTVVPALIALCLAAACATTDEGLTSTVKSKLESDQTVREASIEVQTQDGVVTLTGNVDHPLIKEQAIALARSTEGVNDVVDHIATASPDGSRGDAPHVDRTAGRALDDANVTRRVKGLLLDDGKVRGLSIDVDTRDGIVYLTGSVRSQAEHDRAVELAASVEGVRDVQANLKIQST